MRGARFLKSTLLESAHELVLGERGGVLEVLFGLVKEGRERESAVGEGELKRSRAMNGVNSPGGVEKRMGVEGGSTQP